VEYEDQIADINLNIQRLTEQWQAKTGVLANATVIVIANKVESAFVDMNMSFQQMNPPPEKANNEWFDEFKKQFGNMLTTFQIDLKKTLMPSESEETCWPDHNPNEELESMQDNEEGYDTAFFDDVYVSPQDTINFKGKGNGPDPEILLQSSKRAAPEESGSDEVIKQVRSKGKTVSSSSVDLTGSVHTGKSS
jgi:hypothetical protein